MPRSPIRPSRRSIRLPNVDYSQGGTYFLTICSFDKTNIFGEVRNNIVHLNPIGEIVRDLWLAIPTHFPTIRLHAFILMPNHLHGIVAIEEWARHAVPLQIARNVEGFQNPVSASIPTMVRSFKSAVTKHVRSHMNIPSIQVWQSNYFERILRNGTELRHATRYITENPRRWMTRK